MWHPGPPRRPVDGERRPARTSFPRSGRKPPRGAFIRSTGANVAHGGWCGRVRMSGTTATQRGICPAHRRRCRLWRSWTANGGRRGKFSAFGTKTAQRGVYSTLRGKCGSMVRTSSCVQDDRRPEGRSSVFAGSVARSFVTPVSPVTRIQSPIKENLEKNAFLQNH